MTRSVKENYILNLVNTGSQVLFPLLTFPYACHVIMSEGIGQVSFFSSIINYIALFTSLGIPTYAIREIARERDNAVRMNMIAVEVLLLHAALTIVGYIVIGILCLTVPQIKESLPLFLILSLNVFFSALGCEWFYRGIEDFLYITIQGLVVRVVSVILLFSLVRSADDLILYGWYCVIGVAGGNIFNFIRLHKYIKLRRITFNELRIRRHIKPILQTFTYSIIISLYLNLSPIFLGFLKGALAAGIFTAAIKIKTMLLQLSSCLSSVMMPRLTHLIKENKETEYKRLLQKSYDYTIASSLPICTGLVLCAPSLIMVFCGESFKEAILTSQVIAPVFLAVGLAQVMGFQVLYPKGKIGIIIKSTTIGAITNIVLNLALIPSLSHIGSAIAYLGAETATTIFMYLLGRQYMPITFAKRSHTKYIGGCVLMAVALFAVNLLDINVLYKLIIQVITGGVLYTTLLMLLKDQFVMQAVSLVIKRKKE